MTLSSTFQVSFLILCLTACSRREPQQSGTAAEPAPKPSWFKVDPATAGTLTGTIRFTGAKPPREPIDMDADPACVNMHKGARAFNDSLSINANRTLAHVFVYLKSGLEGKSFEPPAEAATMDQNGCSFQPRVMGIQTGQVFKVTNSDPVTHNIHPLAQVNREWNHSQAGGDPPLTRRFVRPEVMIRVKCNIHSWMRAWVGVVDHPYYAVTGSDGSFEIRNIPPGTYTLAAWQERLGAQEQSITISPSGKATADFTYKGE